jgi:hypothetical protein
MTSEPSEEWYAALGPELSQGDIVRLVPRGHIEAPITICQPANSNPTGKAKYYPLSKVSQRRELEFLHAKFDIGIGIVLWPDCQIDKPKNQGKPEKKWLAAIAPVIPLTTLSVDLHFTVRSLNRAQWFPLPANPPDLPESYVDLRYIWPVQYALLSDRIITLSQAARQAFSHHRFWFDTEVRVRDEVECPHCNKAIDSSIFFRYKDPGE